MFSINRPKLRGIIGALLFTTLLSSVSLFGAEAAAETKIPTRDYKEAFLELALEKTKKYSDAAEGAVTKAVDVAQKEAPELAEQFLLWRFWHSGSVLGINTLVILIFLVIAQVAIRSWRRARDAFVARSSDKTWARQGYTLDDHVGGPVSVVSYVCASITSIVLLANMFGNGHLLTMIQIKIAPKIYLAEQLLALVRK